MLHLTMRLNKDNFILEMRTITDGSFHNDFKLQSQPVKGKKKTL